MNNSYLSISSASLIERFLAYANVIKVIILHFMQGDYHCCKVSLGKIFMVERTIYTIIRLAFLEFCSLTKILGCFLIPSTKMLNE